MRTNPSPHDGEALLELSKANAAYRKHGDEMLKALEATEAKLAAAEAERDELLDALHNPTPIPPCDRCAAAEAVIGAAMNELGVPGDGYPAPVANAYDLLATYRAKETEHAND